MDGLGIKYEAMELDKRDDGAAIQVNRLFAVESPVNQG
jgi:hypothetical protein